MTKKKKKKRSLVTLSSELRKTRKWKWMEHKSSREGEPFMMSHVALSHNYNALHDKKKEKKVRSENGTGAASTRLNKDSLIVNTTDGRVL